MSSKLSVRSWGVRPMFIPSISFWVNTPLTYNNGQTSFVLTSRRIRSRFSSNALWYGFNAAILALGSSLGSASFPSARVNQVRINLWPLFFNQSALRNEHCIPRSLLMTIGKYAQVSLCFEVFHQNILEFAWVP